MDPKVADHLEHFGIKGMRWGVRRARGSNGLVEGGDTKESTGSKKVSRKEKKSAAKAGKKNPTKLMTDDELRATINRMNLEKQYRQLRAEEAARKQSKGKQIAMEIATNVIKTQTQNTANAVIGHQINSRLKKAGLIDGKSAKKAKKEGKKKEAEKSEGANIQIWNPKTAKKGKSVI